MGFLDKTGEDMGKAFSPSATAGSAAAASMGLGSIATGINVGANIASGVGGMQQADFATKVASGNSAAALLAGQEEESASKMKYGGLEAKQVVAQAANGVQVREGSAAKTVASTEAISAMDAALIHFNASRQAFAESASAANYKKAGQGALAKGVMGAGTSFLSGAQSLSDKWLGYKLTGALKVPGGN